MAIAAATLQGAGRVTVGTTPQSLTSGVSVPCAQVVVQLHPDNTVRCVVGGGDAQTLLYDADTTLVINCSDVKDIWAAAESGTAVINYQPKVA